MLLVFLDKILGRKFFPYEAQYIFPWENEGLKSGLSARNNDTVQDIILSPYKPTIMLTILSIT